MGKRLTAILIAAILLPFAVPTSAADDPPPRPRDPAKALPSRGTGEAVLGGRDAFDRDSPQFQIGRRQRSEVELAAEQGVQLAANDQNLSHDCEIGERVELVGSNNIVNIRGQCIGLHVSGDNNSIEIEVVDEIRIRGDRNDIRWRRGFTVERPNMLETGGRNRVTRAGETDDG